MKEIVEFRIVNEYAHLLLKSGEGKKTGSNTTIYITKDDPKFEKIRILNSQIKEKNNDFFFLYSNIKRYYTKKELDAATLLQMKIKVTFEPAGEECGTLYDQTAACKICGANRKQISTLMLKKGSIPKKDIVTTIAGEVVISEKFATAFKQRKLKGAIFKPVVSGTETLGYFQLFASSSLELSDNTTAGVNLFDLSEGSESLELTIPGGYHIRLEKEVYKCPKGHTIGLNLLSEAFVLNDPSITEMDFFASNQMIGVKRGLLRPGPLYLCSPNFRKMVEEEKLSGFEFEIAHIQ
ncbi:hypothetical protein ADIARSV_0029 [Arcticibacter svalbardensis MN12-7]|uniref:Uncharacterized protein n=1 Tax=Arcticibacter svalbardensis MN12-7 TaxID=1150600 RepID=R9GYE0_9SPHI|nr:hypothetical protein [Arcticibacter svalbardensis]EOR96766.1 hypothetical protein ADIARSV_0029 [Arcticibacter svalbardensis MN12-7]